MTSPVFKDFLRVSHFGVCDRYMPAPCTIKWLGYIPNLNSFIGDSPTSRNLSSRDYAESLEAKGNSALGIYAVGAIVVKELTERNRRVLVRDGRWRENFLQISDSLVTKLVPGARSLIMDLQQFRET